MRCSHRELIPHRASPGRAEPIPALLTIERPLRHVTVVRVEGTLGLAVLEHFASTLHRAGVIGHDDVVVDLTLAPSVDVAFVGHLVVFGRMQERADRRLAVVVGAQSDPGIRELIRPTARPFLVHRELESALQALY